MSETKSLDEPHHIASTLHFVRSFGKVDGQLGTGIDKKDGLDGLKVEDNDDKVDYVEEYRYNIIIIITIIITTTTTTTDSRLSCS